MLRTLRVLISSALLLLARLFSTLFYRCEVVTVPDGATINWANPRVVAVLNHTSLLEWLFIAAPPFSFLVHAARRAVVPVADVTLDRPLVGPLFRLLISDVIRVTREPDETWAAVLDKVSGDNMIVIFPEGRMKRVNGLDKHGNPMTVRGGIADILSVAGRGSMILAYSGGLHHVQAPGSGLLRLFKTIRIAIEQIDIADYMDAIGHPPGTQAFKEAVTQDLERRRDRYCPAPQRSIDK